MSGHMVRGIYLVECVWLSEILAVQDSHESADQQFQSAPVFVSPSGLTFRVLRAGHVLFPMVSGIIL